MCVCVCMCMCMYVYVCDAYRNSQFSLDRHQISYQVYLRWGSGGWASFHLSLRCHGGHETRRRFFQNCNSNTKTGTQHLWSTLIIMTGLFFLLRALTASHLLSKSKISQSLTCDISCNPPISTRFGMMIHIPKTSNNVEPQCPSTFTSRVVRV